MYKIKYPFFKYLCVAFRYNCNKLDLYFEMVLKTTKSNKTLVPNFVHMLYFSDILFYYLLYIYYIYIYIRMLYNKY